MTKFVSIFFILAGNPEDCEKTAPTIKEMCNGDEQSSHVLVLKWCHVKNKKFISGGVDPPLGKAKTQQTVLNFVSSVFDPVGLVAPNTSWTSSFT